MTKRKKPRSLSQKTGKVHGVISRGEQAWCYLCDSQHYWARPCAKTCAVFGIEPEPGQ